MAKASLSQTRGIGGKLSMLGRLRLFPRYLRDGSVAFWRKGLMVLLAAYILSPVDAIPEIILPFVGWLDDLGVLGILLTWFYREMGNYGTEGEQTELQK
ncbi:MAG: YkvA family protein [Candidatus Kapaibacterium sp.]